MHVEVPSCSKNNTSDDAQVHDPQSVCQAWHSCCPWPSLPLAASGFTLLSAQPGVIGHDRRHRKGEGRATPWRWIRSSRAGNDPSVEDFRGRLGEEHERVAPSQHSSSAVPAQLSSVRAQALLRHALTRGAALQTVATAVLLLASTQDDIMAAVGDLHEDGRDLASGGGRVGSGPPIANAGETSPSPVRGHARNSRGSIGDERNDESARAVDTSQGGRADGKEIGDDSDLMRSLGRVGPRQPGPLTHGF